MSNVHSWHVTGGISSEIPDTSAQNSIEEFVSWLRSDETPLIYKIGASALPVILGYAIGALIGYPLLTAALVTLTFGMAAYAALRALTEREQTALRIAEHNLRLEEELTFFQRLTQGGWNYGTRGDGIEDSTRRIGNSNRDPVFHTVLEPADFATIRQIGVERNHPVLSLV